MPTKSKFQGSDIVKELDEIRLTGQIRRIYDLMKDGRWRSLREIAYKTLDGEASISAQLRNLRKPQFGGHAVMRRRRGMPDRGLFEYQLLINKT
jgi:hypothetical protein